ncbi:MarR family winged helix-turn-helix transcriptional regulator [Xanthobacter sp. V4C-4]|uniref:MarR family winged helix-turn-helix transcriptional regulator n=1 Tax=Xanthobacter cornucopiae TaxID=3119924 RepID=UPI003728D69E
METPSATPLPHALPELTDHLGFWLRAVSNHVSHAFAAKLDGKGVTVAEWVMLRALHDTPPAAPSRLAATMGMTRGAITRLADRLIAKGLMVRAAHPDDGRAQTLALTPEGAALLPELAALADRNDAETFDVLSADERETLSRLLKKMVAHRRILAMPLD